MKNCLQCKKDFESKREAGKFCSTSCRVMWNRKNGKKGEKGLTELQQMKVMYNSLMEKIDKISLPQMPLSEMMAPLTEKNAAFKGILPHENGTPQAISNTTKQKLDIKRTPAHWVELRRECETADDYAKWLEDLENDTFLTTREKAQIKQTV